MLLAAIAIGVVIVALLWDLLLPPAREAFERFRARRAIVPNTAYDPGRERRAEQRARELLRSCVNDEEWSMYRDLGFIRVWGAMAQAPKRPGVEAQDPRTGAPYAYLVYPHKPIVAYLPQTRELLNEYCVARRFGLQRSQLILNSAYWCSIGTDCVHGIKVKTNKACCLCFVLSVFMPFICGQNSFQVKPQAERAARFSP